MYRSSVIKIKQVTSTTTHPSIWYWGVRTVHLFLQVIIHIWNCISSSKDRFCQSQLTILHSFSIAHRWVGPLLYDRLSVDERVRAWCRVFGQNHRDSSAGLLLLWYSAVYLRNKDTEQMKIYVLRSYMMFWLKGLIWPPLEPKTESCFTPISSYWFIRRIAQV